MAREIKRRNTRNVKAAAAGEISQARAEIAEKLENVKPETKKKVEDFLEIKIPTIEEKKIVIDVINKDSLIALEDKDKLAQLIMSSFAKKFTFNACPTDPIELREESIYLSKLANTSLILIAERANIIRDKHYYLSYGYNDFSAWVEGELKVNRQSVYNYIDLINTYGVQALGHVKTPSKLIPALPLFKADCIDIAEKDRIKTKVIEDSDNFSYRDMVEKIKKIKLKYGLIKEKDIFHFSSSVQVRESGIWIGNKSAITFANDLDRETKKRLSKDFEEYFKIEESGNHASIIETYNEVEEKWLINQLKKHRSEK